MPKFNDLSALLLKEAIDSGVVSPTELSSLMANAAVETGYFKRMHEDLYYRTIAGVLDAVASADERFTLAQIQAAIDSRDPKQIATILYEGRSGEKDLGNTQPGDGAKYYGRGYFQYTGRGNYEKYGKKFGYDLINDPDQAAEPKVAAKLAVAYWKERVFEINRHDARLAGKDINGGDNGGLARAAAQVEWSKTITPELVQDIQTGKITLDQLSFHGWDALKDGKLKPNERGMEIRDLQHHLNDLGIADAKGRRLHPNGTFDKPTQQAVAAFQRQLGLPDKSPVTAETLRAAEFYAGAPEILRRPLQPALTSELPEMSRDPVERLPPRMPPSYQNDWLPRDAEGASNYLHSHAPAAPDRSSLPDIHPVQAQLKQVQREVEAPQPPRSRESASRAPELKTGLREETQLPAAIRPAHEDTAVPVDSRRTVANLQSDLIQLGYHHRVSQPLQVSGVYDDATRQAVTAFQAQHELAISGVADQATQLALQQALLAPRLQAKAADPRDESHKAEQNAAARGDSHDMTGILRAFSDRQHPQHALYADVQQRFQAKGHDLSEEHLSALTRQMHLSGYKPGWPGDVIVYKGKAVVASEYLTQQTMFVELKAPVASVQETMQGFQGEQQNLAQYRESFRQQQVSQGQALS